MKKILYTFLLLCISGTAYMQVSSYTQTTPFDTLVATPDTLNYQFTGTALGATGNVSLTVYYEGDFGSSAEYISFYGEGGILIGVTQPYFDGNDCMADSVTLIISSSYFNLWAANDTINIYGITSNNVDLFCTANHAQLKLTYDYCTSGIVAMLSVPQTTFCPLDAAITVTTSPAGGTLTGTGLTGNSFSPAGLTPDTSYLISYSFVDTAGCPSESNAYMVIESAPDVTPVDTICPGNTVQLTAVGNGETIWFLDAGLTQAVDTGSTITSPPVLVPTTFYATSSSTDNYFMITNLSSSDSIVVDHDINTGDDRGGIAVTTSYIYIAGDDSTTRFDLDLTNPVSYVGHADGIFSDLENGQLYTLYNPITGIPDADLIDSMYITQLYTLNADLTLGATAINLSDSIAFGWDNYTNGIFPGNGFLIIYSSPKESWYKIDLTTGNVILLAEAPFITAFYSETWSEWGIGEFNGNDYSALYRNDNDGNIHRYSIMSGTDVIFQSFSDLSDMASFTYAPWNNRWYLHFEGGSQFNGMNETLVSAIASDSTGNNATVTFGCINAITVNLGCAGVEEENINFSVYPIPSNGFVTIKAANNNTDWNVSVISISGAAIYQTRLIAGENLKQLDLSHVAPGIYFVNIQNATTTQTVKVIIQN